jgi:hypothetical protein
MQTLPVRPPGLWPLLRASFDKITTHLHLLLLPVALDLWLWLGPRLQAPALFERWLQDVEAAARSLQAPADIWQQVANTWQEVLPRINFFASVRTFPVGVPGLMWMRLPADAPLPVRVWSLPSWGAVLLAVLGITLLGWLLGSLYLYQTGRVAGAVSRPWAQIFPAVLAQMLLLSAALLALSFFLSAAVLLFPAAAQWVLLFGLAVVFWWALPLFFAPYGIYAFGEGPLQSLRSALRFVRYGQPFTSGFFFVLLSFSWLSVTVWNIPDDRSWLLLLGILGHAFVSAGLTVASFSFYRAMRTWQTLVLEHFSRLQADGGSFDHTTD